MPSFQHMFTESEGRPIKWQGKTLVCGDFLPTRGATTFRLVIESCNGTWRQGVAMDLAHQTCDGTWHRGADEHSNGSFVVNGRAHDGKNGIFFWQDDIVDAIEFEVVGNPSAIDLFNVWDTGNGVMDSRHNGAAMIVEELPNGRRYRCNDGYADEDFDDIIFRIEAIPEKSPPKQKIAHKLANLVRKTIVIEADAPDTANGPVKGPG